ncbi:MAG: type III-A CRISPR-associated protein Cas10/Csm1 [Christensenellales bacterium]
MDKRDKVVLAGIWHDIGKMVRRSGESGEHSRVGAEFLKKCGMDADIVRACRYHHGEFLDKAKIQNDDISYIIYVADNISSSADRRCIEGDENCAFGFNEHICLKSVFNILNNHSANLGYSDANTKNVNEISFPTEVGDLTSGMYTALLNKVKEILICKDYSINSILELIEGIMTYIPSCTAVSDLNDISLYDHCKLTAGIGVCIYDYLMQNNITDFKSELRKNEKIFINKKAFILASFDISGIQKFIYSIPSQEALKQLRARSAYLDIISEYLVDEILNELNLSRANLVYNGGGHCYLILPNIESVKFKFYEIIKKQNEWFLTKFRESLFISGACVECSANELCNKDEKGNISKDNVFGQLFSTLQSQLSKNKLQRYSAKDINALNFMHNQAERECSVCGNSSVEICENGKCAVCEALTNIGKNIINKNNSFFVITREKETGCSNLEFFSYRYGQVYLQIMEEKDLKDRLAKQDENIISIYSKNTFNVGVKYSTKIYMGDYCAWKDSKPMSFDDFEENSQGIKRLAVFRADVDNLGLTFKNGFKNNGNFEYETLSRFATLSRVMSRFFKLYINQILNDNYAKFSTVNLFGSVSGNRNLAIIYSGGDDLCFVGSYDDVIRSAIDLRNNFKKYCSNTMTISGGIGLYSSGYPVSRMAVEVGELESVSKACKDKDCITLFDDSGNYTFKWDEFENDVINDKLHYIENYFDKKEISAVAGGNSFIYKLIEFLRSNERTKIAYTLARLLDDENEFDREFTNKVYNWSRNDIDRKQLITALTLYVYSKREDER